jgi:CRP-like cAMP-binding protein
MHAQPADSPSLTSAPQVTPFVRSPAYVGTRLRHLGLDNAVANETARVVKVHAFAPGTKMWSKGGEVPYWRYIIEGLVAASMPTTTCASTPISIYGKGAWFGEQSIINRKPSFADYVCLTETQVLSLPAARFDTLFEQQPEFARHVAKLMAWRAQKTSETLTLMKLGNPAMRVVMGLAQFAEALAYRSERPPTIGFGDGVELPVAQNTLAALCGVSRTLFSEYVQQLAQREWLALSYGRLEIMNIATWHRFARRQRENSFNALNPTITELLDLMAQLGEMRDPD